MSVAAVILAALPSGHVTVRSVVRVTSVARTVVDMARTWRRWGCGILVRNGRQSCAEPAGLQEILAGRRRGRTRLAGGRGRLGAGTRPDRVLPRSSPGRRRSTRRTARFGVSGGQVVAGGEGVRVLLAQLPLAIGEGGLE
jgi:hypothetical protein